MLCEVYSDKLIDCRTGLDFEDLLKVAMVVELSGGPISCHV